ncbi:glycoprotease pgp1 [Sodiomyces alkalinus F11]|uniref:N(6)-L-threonylcarbamoyladenine synthase n=1 Tax=Sodiomyces alkalinus (strain CBS 110278 / VKM F-3762 / F11) TaxID=1314773 RepID=A0A3N2PS59_SODAK|nr:glycoprotease pgp1 [Sodiomyces alkalinus F11]ROT37328.1 glycoprotease pgp1 [Sodiomyces alkalinus F11]
MRASCRPLRPWLAAPSPRFQATHGIRQWHVHPTPTSSRRRNLLTLAIETSCDDTCVAILSKHDDSSATLHYNRKHTSDNRAYGGVHPVVAIEGHTSSLAELICESLAFLPPDVGSGSGSTLVVRGKQRRIPDFVSVTRGPGMLANLSAGLNTAKGLAAAWQVPLVGVNHMQAHALTPRLVTALEQRRGRRRDGYGSSPTENTPADGGYAPAFPFLSLLVSGGHTILVHSRGLNDHRILAEAADIAVGDAIDKAARLVLPADVVAGAKDVMFGRMFEAFAFPEGEGDGAAEPPPPDAEGVITTASSPLYRDYQPPQKRVDEITPRPTSYGWQIIPPMIQSRRMAYAFSGLGSQIRRIVEDASPGMSLDGRRVLARESMRVMFEHLASRVVLALEDPELGVRDIRTLVVSGGVASNRFLMHILRTVLDVRGYESVAITAPPRELCTDNAAMIAWTGLEMYEAGYKSQLSVRAIRKWPLDPTGEDGGILGVDGWTRRDGDRSPFS